MQGGEDSPGKWVMFDDPFCTKMEELESEGFGAVMEVPFCAPVNSYHVGSLLWMIRAIWRGIMQGWCSCLYGLRSTMGPMVRR